ncbi:thioredoxin domain-containing protein [Candidatus Woesearchaeota archaeon]|nr:thioredoxin domain-containing protein [Candidatus Woesearchaeota archaeon]
MKIKKPHLYAIVGVVIVITIFLVLRGVNKPVYQNIDSPRPILGNPQASVSVVEFSDIQCPACKNAAAYPHRLINEFGESISFEFKHFPLAFHQYAFDAAMAAECANDHGKFWEFVDMAYVNQDNIKKKDLKKYASNLGLDTSLFSACLDSEAKKEIVESHIREGYSRGVSGTPTFFVNGRMAESISYSAVKELIEQELG